MNRPLKSRETEKSKSKNKKPRKERKKTHKHKHKHKEKRKRRKSKRAKTDINKEAKLELKRLKEQFRNEKLKKRKLRKALTGVYQSPFDTLDEMMLKQFPKSTSTPHSNLFNMDIRILNNQETNYSQKRMMANIAS